MEDPPAKRGDPVRVRWVITLYDPELQEQGRSTCRSRVWGVTGIDHFYEMDPGLSRELANDVEGELRYLLENEEPEDVRRMYGCR